MFQETGYFFHSKWNEFLDHKIIPQVIQTCWKCQPSRGCNQLKCGVKRMKIGSDQHRKIEYVGGIILVLLHRFSTHGAVSISMFVFRRASATNDAVSSMKHVIFLSSPYHQYSYWVVVWNMNFIFHFIFHIWDVILPIDEHHHFSRGVGQPPPRK